MATITQMICDKCRSNSGVATIDWEIGTETGQIDLCSSCLRAALKAVTVSSSTSKSAVKVSASHVIRAWAKRNGYEVPEKGRIPTEVMQAYNARLNSAPSIESIA